MRQPACSLRLHLKAFEIHTMLQKMRVQQLECHHLVHQLLPRLIHDTHAALTDERQNLVLVGEVRPYKRS